MPFRKALRLFPRERNLNATSPAAKPYNKDETQDGVSGFTSHDAPQSSRVAATSLSSAPKAATQKKDLWDEAYQTLYAEEEELVEKYEQILLLGENEHYGSITQLGAFGDKPVS